MNYKLSYKKKLFAYFFVVFLVFSAAVAIFQYNREKEYRIGQLENTLDNYSELVNSYITNNTIYNSKKFEDLKSFIKIIPKKDIRVTVIDLNGDVLFDSFVSDYSSMENHKKRPEIQESLYSAKGSSIRQSTSTRKDFYYYSRFYKKYFVRTAIIYNFEIEEFLKTERVFLYFIVFLFFIVWGSLVYVSDKLGASLSKLKDFAIKAGRNEKIDTDVKFPKNELGVIGKQIIQIYNSLKKTKDELSNEKEKLIQHLHISQEGIAIFSHEKKSMLANNYFIQYVNLLSDTPAISPNHVFEIADLKPVIEFIDAMSQIKVNFSATNLPGKKLSLNKNGMYFFIQCLMFPDKSFEISINDVTKLEKRKLLKQQMTTNIAHELRTPVSSIKGYLETIINNSQLDTDKQLHFITKAHSQTERLTELIHDISILTKIEEASDLFNLENVNIKNIINDVIENRENRLKEKNITINIKIDTDIILRGNKSLINSIFQNLTENAINYAGTDIIISIENYLNDDNYFYFTFSDTGKGISDEKHLSRIFERFYRIDDGRDRRIGGTGLGLAIVKNAVLFHKGNISVKNRTDGGLEFLFSIKKA